MSTNIDQGQIEIILNDEIRPAGDTAQPDPAASASERPPVASNDVGQSPTEAPKGEPEQAENVDGIGSVGPQGSIKLEKEALDGAQQTEVRVGGDMAQPVVVAKQSQPAPRHPRKNSKRMLKTGDGGGADSNETVTRDAAVEQKKRRNKREAAGEVRVESWVMKVVRKRIELEANIAGTTMDRLIAKILSNHFSEP